MYEQYLFQSPLNEISDDFIRKTTGINYGGKHYSDFYDSKNNSGRNRRVTAVLFRNMGNQLKRETEQNGGITAGKLLFNARDPYYFGNSKMDKDFGTVQVNGIPGVKTHAYFLNHPDQKRKIDAYNNQKNAIAAQQRQQEIQKMPWYKRTFYNLINT